MGTDWKELADSAEYRSKIYGLLATIFREEPTEALIRELRNPRFAGVFLEMEIDMGEVLNNIPESSVVDKLGIEFTRLFIGPGSHISAHESIYSEVDNGMSALWGAKTVEVKNFIETAGLDYKPEFNGVPDHVSVELEFMQKLTQWEAVKWAEKDPENAEYGQLVQRKFLIEHLLCWLPIFCDQVMAQAELPFYRDMAALTKNYMDFEKQNMATESAA